MPELESCQVHRILLKPDAAVGLSDSSTLTDDYMATLHETLDQQESAVSLGYVRPMSGGVHVLSVTPVLTMTQMKQLTELLTERDDVDYAEPDLPRRR